MRKFLDEVDGTIENLKEGEDRTVLSLFPINKLCGKC
jgi:hypothetical protein